MKKFLLFLLAGALAVPAPEAPSIRGFAPNAARAQAELERKARAVPDPVKLRAYMEHMTRVTHSGGTPESKAVAEYAANLMRGWGLDVRIEQAEALMPYPTERKLGMVSPVRYTAQLKEPLVEGDRGSRDPKALPTFNAYSASGDVTAPLVYVNYGIPDDYAELKKLGVDVRGKIVIARYGRSWRGTKAKTAQQNGAIGCLIYSDPRDDGFYQGDVYPKGPYRPEHGVQRGSVVDMPLYPGDPLSPGWASEPGAKKLDRDKAESIMKIPVLPISWADAKPLLAQLDGPVAPEAWRGALPLTYHIGPGPAKVHLKVDFDWTTKPLYNVIATIPGAEHPDQWVIYGNHHDAWNTGADDPVSGASALLETARSLSILLKDGWRPKRTIRLALWDGEEFGLLGSTEWVEKHRAELQQKAVAYLNTDNSGAGTLKAGGSPSLEAFFGEVMRDVEHPSGKGSLLDVRPVSKGEKTPYRMDPAGAGSDYVAFLHHSGIASLNTGFEGGSPGGIYHSNYDSFDWYTKYSDKDFRHGQALSRVMTTAILRLAEAPVLPFGFTEVVQSVEKWMADLPKVDTKELASALERLRKAAGEYEAALKNAKPTPAANEKIYKAERALLDETGLPGRPWYKHHLMAPGAFTGYSAKTLPAVSDSPDAQAGVRSLAAALRRYSDSIGEASKLLAP